MTRGRCPALWPGCTVTQMTFSWRVSGPTSGAVARSRNEPRPAPPDMVRIDVGHLDVGRGFIEVLRDCGEIGRGCYLPQMLDEVPRRSVA